MTEELIAVEVKGESEPLYFPASMSDAEIKAALDQRYQPQSFLEKAGELPGKVAETVSKGWDRTVEGATEDPYENPVSLGADIGRMLVTGPAQDVGELGVDAWQRTWGRHPIFNNPVVKKAFKAIADSEIADKAARALTQGKEYWNWFKKEHPVEAATLEDAGVLLELMPQKTGVSGGRKLIKRGSASEIRQRREGLFRMIRPDDMEHPDISVTELPTYKMRMKHGEIKPDTKLDRVVSALEIVDEFKPERSAIYNANVAEKAAERFRHQLDRLIVKANNPKVDKEAVMADLDDFIANMDKLEGYNTLPGNARTHAKEYLEELKNILGEKKVLRARDVLNARKEFDRRVDTAGMRYDSDIENARLFAARHMRNILNDEFKRVLPGDEAHHLLYMQHQILSARDMLVHKRKYLANHMFARAWNAAQRYGHMPNTPLAIYATAAAAAPVVPYAAAGAAGGATIWAMYRGLSRGERLKELGRLKNVLNQMPDHEVAAYKTMIAELMQIEQEQPSPRAD